MNKLVLEAQEFQDELVAYRRCLHENPEVGLDLPLTAAFVQEKLEEMGYVTQRVGESGITALAGGKKPGKVFLLRADMDALPICEETDVEFKSKNENMHACGHDMHTTMLLGAAKLLKRHEEEIEGTIKLMFQPGEEVLLGAKEMIKCGVLDNPKVDAAMMFHVATGYPVPPGVIVVPDSGVFSAASDRFEIDIKGAGGHGAMPETTVDPLIVASHTHLAIQAIRSREIPGSENAVVTVGQISGGSTYNVIPDTAFMKGTIRTFNPEMRKFIPERIEQISNCVAEGFRAKAEVNIIEGCPSVINDKEVTYEMRKVMTETFGERAVPEFESLGLGRLSGSEDFSYVTEEVPSAMLMISAGNAKDGYVYPAHHPKAKFDESVLFIGAAAYAAAGMGWLRDNKVDKEC